MATIALTPVEDARPFGLVERDAHGRVRGFLEKPADPIPGEINAGTYALEPGALDQIPMGVMVSIERETYPSLIDRGEAVFAYPSDAYWRDLGTPAAYLEAHVDALDGRIGGRRYPAPLVAEDATVHPSSEVGRDVVVGPGARVGDRATVRRSVLHGRVAVGEGASVEGSILGAGVVVEPGAAVRDSVLAEGARVEAEARVADALVSAGRRLRA